MADKKKKNTDEPTPEPEPKPKKAVLANPAVVPAPGQQSKSQTDVCISRSPTIRTPGEQVRRWGYVWEVAKDGRTLQARIPKDDVENGMAAGRWRPKGSTQEEVSEAMSRREFREIFGQPADPDMEPDEVQRLIDMELRRQERNRKNDAIFA